MPISEETVLAALRQINDPELLVNIVDLGLIYGVDVTEENGHSNIQISMTMTSPACPFAPALMRQVKDLVGAVHGVGSVEVTLTLSPPWTPDRMSDDARDELGLF